MKLSAAVFAATSVALASSLASAQGTQRTYDINASKDSTILRSTVSCPACPNSNCYECTKGGEQTLDISSGGHAVNYAIIGFTLPSEAVGAPDRLDSCSLSLPHPNTQLTAEVVLPISSADPFWDEYTINGNNAPAIGPNIGQAVIPNSGEPPAIDLTQACKQAAARGSGFSIYLNPAPATFIQFTSKEGWKASVLHATVH